MTMKLEYILYLMIFILQLYFFWGTRKKINVFANIFSRKDFNLDDDLYDNDDLYEKDLDESSNSSKKAIVKNAIVDKEYEKIKKMIKNYIRSSTREFPLLDYAIKRTEEHLNKLEDEINRSLSTPLYFGLMATILGIILGLREYSSGDGADGIPALIWSVRYAMMLSFSGLFLMVLNSTKKYSDAKNKLEETKEKFYDFLRSSGKFSATKEGFVTAIRKMQENLKEFNNKLGSNLNKMGEGYEKSLKIIADIDMKALQNVLQEMNTIVGEFNKFSNKFKNVNEYLMKMEDFFSKFSSFEHLTKTAVNLEDIAAKMKDSAESMNKSVDGNGKILNFLNDNIQNLEEIKNKVIATDNEVHKTLDIVKDNLSDSSIKTEKLVEDFLNQTQNNVGKFTDNISDTNNNFIDKITNTNSDVSATFSELAKNIRGITPSQWKNNAIVGQLDSFAKKMVTSFDEIHSSMNKWKEKIKEEVKKETKAHEETKIKESIDTLNMLLTNIQENSKPRSLIMILKDLIGISR